jgi:hypothetical protein
MDPVKRNTSAVTLGFGEYPVKNVGQQCMGDIKTKTISPLGK